MIIKPRINTSFQQRSGSCVLSSYAIVGNYFTGFPIEKFFEDYCRHFGIDFKSSQEAENKYADHFHHEHNRQKCPGYKVILNLHSNSMEQSFIESRKLFSADFYPDTSQSVGELENQLKEDEETILNITYPEFNGACHSVTVFHDREHFWRRNTNTTGLDTISTLTQIGSLKDGVLYKKIKATAAV